MPTVIGGHYLNYLNRENILMALGMTAKFVQILSKWIYSSINLKINNQWKIVYVNCWRRIIFYAFNKLCNTVYVIWNLPMYFLFHPVFGYKRIPNENKHELAFLNNVISETRSTAYTESIWTPVFILRIFNVSTLHIKIKHFMINVHVVYNMAVDSTYAASAMLMWFLNLLIKSALVIP